MLVDDGGNLEAVGGGLQRRDRAVFEGLDAEGTGPAGEQALEESIGGAEVQDRHGPWFAVDASAFDDAPVGVSFGPDCLEACHIIMYTHDKQFVNNLNENFY
jgi:hypothetical protein